MNTELLLGNSAFMALAAEWDALASRGMTDTPFQTLAYQKAWWTYVQPPGAELLTVVTRGSGDELIGIGCFFLLNGGLHFNGCVEETDYLDLIVPAEQVEVVWRATWNCLLAADFPAWGLLDLCNIPADSPTRTILPALAHESDYVFEEIVAEVCPIIALPGDFETYLASLDSKQRRELSRKLRRAEAADVTTTIVGPADDLAAEVDSFLDLMQYSTFEKRDWLNAGRRALFHDVARTALDASTLQLMFTSVEGRRAAALFNFDYKDRIWVYNSGLDPTVFAALSPGVVLTATAIERAIELGRKEFDFLRGDEEYKYRFGAVDSQIFRLRVTRED
jgi:CelD/BcsL family acetyltransferase involved in cellulose biosynthesis